MKKETFTCIGCPIGCTLDVTMIDEDNIIVEGNQCSIGDCYGRKEIVEPVRVVTTSVFVEYGVNNVVLIKTDKEINKKLIMKLVKSLKNTSIKAPVHIGDVVVKNVLGSDVNMIATSEVLKK